MKKKLLIVFGVLIIGLLSWMGYSSIKKLDQKAESEKIVQRLSSFATKLKLENINTGQSTIFIYFNSDCHFCQWEMKEIQKNIEKFEDYQLMLASFEPKSEAIRFLNEHNLSAYYVEAHPDLLTSTIMGGVPQTFIYKNGELEKHFKGEVKIEAILQVLR
ncbi:redoxin domain-containing protein [Marivirga sp. S37H4]|uniref:Redoxin domain-containing protein n=1 Tax=Marivirga aurantiaca TaxID=2802615 RepID=A0A935C959_9BACT|nr:redoxin domain-containing protein [Marivirga aurantiaca]MBK6265870.1 redoxin domain-containing protein [Marivirga aurantiaca]